MKRKSYIIESENGIGLYLSKYLAEKNLRYLTKEYANCFECDSYEAGKEYIFKNYRYDKGIHLEEFRVNRTLFRDKLEKRGWFYVQSHVVIGYGMDDGMKMSFVGFFGINPYESIIEVDSEWEAKSRARRGFVEEYGNPAYYYAGELCPGESIAFKEMLWINGLVETRPTFEKVYGIGK